MTAPAEQPILSAENLAVHFDVSRAFQPHRTVYAVDGVDLAVRENEAVGIIGESGCGKTTTGRALAHLERATAGTIRFRGEDITAPDRQRLRALRQELQFVFQDPHSSLNSRMTIQEIIAEPLRAFGMWRRSDGSQRVAEILDRVGLPRQAMQRYPHEFSGGQRQRIGIARALVLDPSVVILDEPVSALDVSVQAQILNLLMELRATSRLAFVMISHDLEVIRHVTDRVCVMYLGTIVETGPSEDVLADPAHPYTLALASATPPASPFEQRERIVLRGDPPSPSAPPSGCRFRTRCWRATSLCEREAPVLRPLDESGRQVACHFPVRDGLAATGAVT